MKKKLAFIATASLIMNFLCSCGTNNSQTSANMNDSSELQTETTVSTDANENSAESTDYSTEIKSTTTEITTTTTIEQTTETTMQVSPEERENGTLDVERGFFTTKVTFPESFINMLKSLSSETEDSDSDSSDSVAIKVNEDKGIIDVTENPDGSITVTYKTSAYLQYLKDERTDFDKSCTEIIADDQSSIVAIEPDNNLQNIEITVKDEQSYNGSFYDTLALFGLYLQAGFYQVFADKTNNGTATVKFTIIDRQTGNVIETTTYPKG